MSRHRRFPALLLSTSSLALIVLAVPVTVFAQDEGSPPEAALEIEVALEPATIGMGEVARLTVSIRGEGFTPRELGEPTFSLENLDVAGGPSRQENLTIVNGQASRTYRLVWYVKPRQPGAARVHDIRLLLGGREVGLPDRSMEVTEAPRRPAREDSDGRRTSPLEDLVEQMLGGRDRDRPRSDPAEPPQVRLEARVTRERPWVGEQVTYELDLLVERRHPGEGTIRVDSIYPRALPEFEGFWSQEIPLPDQVRPEVVQSGGRTFWRQPVVKRALFPRRGGERLIEEAVLELQVVHYRSSVWGEQRSAPENVEVRSDPVRITVRPLPPPPPEFSGAVGFDLRLRTDVEPAVLEADEAAVLTTTLEGRGHLGGIADPELPPVDGLRIHPPEETSSRGLVGEQVSERRSWRWTLVPAREGRWTIPALSWVYFDPRAGTYRELQTEPIRLAAAGPTPITDPPAGGEETEPPAAGPGSQPGETPGAEGMLEPRWRLPWWAFGGAFAGISLLAFLVLWLRRRRKASERVLITRLRSLPDESPRRTASTAEEAWRTYLQEQWSLPQGVPCREWPDHLRREGADPGTARELVDLMEDLHYLRYAPQLASAEALGAELLPRSRRILRRL